MNELGVSLRAMDAIAAGFWGAFFGTAALMLVVSLAAFLRSHRRVALMSGLSSVMSAAFVVAYLGWLPLGPEAEARLLAHVSVILGAGLALMLLSMLGALRGRGRARRAGWALAAFAAAICAVGWLLPARDAQALASAAAFALGAGMLAVTVRAASRGDRLAWLSVTGVLCMLVSVGGLAWIALHRPGDWPAHAVSAVAGVAYLATMAFALWNRYSYLIELSQVLALGPSYDPVTRMRSHSETGQMVGDVFFRREGGVRPVGVMAICIANLYALENLHGRAAVNHALFVCASRLRRVVPANVEMGRLGDDGFLLLIRTPAELAGMQHLARSLRDRLARPVTLSTRRDPAMLEEGDTSWVAELGIGVLGTTTVVRPAQAVSTARAMARTAWSFPSRLAWFDPGVGQIAELPPDGTPMPPVAGTAPATATAS